MPLTYHWEGDYQYPDLEPEEPPTRQITKYGSLRRTFLKESRPEEYYERFLDGTLQEHLADIEEMAIERMDRIVEGMLKLDPGPDQMQDQLGWVRHRNNLESRAEEIVLHEIVFN
jgi:hypothetical protein